MEHLFNILFYINTYIIVTDSNHYLNKYFLIYKGMFNHIGFPSLQFEASAEFMNM